MEWTCGEFLVTLLEGKEVQNQNKRACHFGYIYLFVRVQRGNGDCEDTIASAARRKKMRGCSSIHFQKQRSSLNAFMRIRGEAESKWFPS